MDRRKQKPSRRRILARRLGALAVLTSLVLAAVLLAGGGGSGRSTPGRHHPPPPGSAVPTAEKHGSVANLAPGSNPSVLPGPVLIADRNNNRVIEISPTGRLLWEFPRPGDLRPGETFRVPDDAFFAPDGRQVIVTQEDDFVISMINMSSDRIVYRYGHPGVSGSSADYLYNPDDALLTRSGQIFLADIKNCRLLVITPPAHHVAGQRGETGLCIHQPPTGYGGPNGWFPLSNGNTVVTEINGDWIDILGPYGKLLNATHAPGFSYPSDTNEVRRGVLLSADYTDPGAIETFTPGGRLLWRYAPSGSHALNHPSLALPLPNGDVLANDDLNDRVIVVDPRTDRIVWQYGHTRNAGHRAGYLARPDGVDLAAPYNLMSRFP